jgi:hypothetical protein
MRPPARTFLIAAAMCVATLSCDSVTGNDCDRKVSSDLKRIMYWGTVAADQDEANHGYESGEIRQPLWYRPGGIFVNTGRVDKGAFVRGLFDISIDPVTYSFRSFHTFAFPFLIRDFDYDPSSGQFAVTFSRDPVNIQVVRALGQDTALAVVDTVAGAAWFPRAARFLESSGGIVVYARNPTTEVEGFYHVPSTVSEPDSLILSIDLSIDDARAFDVAAGKLCFGVSSDDFRTSSVYVIDLDANRGPRRLATVNGVFVSCAINRQGSYALIATELFLPNSSGSAVGVLNMSTGRVQGLDVRTTPCGFVLADHPSWNNKGDAFAFVGSAYTGESQEFPWELWARTKVSFP